MNTFETYMASHVLLSAFMTCFLLKVMFSYIELCFSMAKKRHVRKEQANPCDACDDDDGINSSKLPRKLSKVAQLGTFIKQKVSLPASLQKTRSTTMFSQLSSILQSLVLKILSISQPSSSPSPPKKPQTFRQAVKAFGSKHVESSF